VVATVPCAESASAMPRGMAAMKANWCDTPRRRGRGEPSQVVRPVKATGDA
jgi:hypothetical protein